MTDEMTRQMDQMMEKSFGAAMGMGMGGFPDPFKDDFFGDSSFGKFGNPSSSLLKDVEKGVSCSVLCVRPLRSVL